RGYGMNLWYGWGDAESATALPPKVSDLLEQAFGIKPGSTTVAAIDAVRLPAAALDPAVRGGLAAAGGEANVLDSAEARVRHTRGKSTVDLLRMRAGEADDAPDAVVLPGG